MMEDWGVQPAGRGPVANHSSGPEGFLKGYINCSSCPYFYDDAEGCSAWSEGQHAPSLLTATNCILVVLAALSLGFTISVHRHYNHVLLIHRRVRTNSVSNVRWILFFTAVSARMLLEVGRDASLLHNAEALKEPRDVALFYLASMAWGAAMALLCFALEHQRRHRSSGYMMRVASMYDAVGLNSPPTRSPVYNDRLATAASGGRGCDLGIGLAMSLFTATLLAQITTERSDKLYLFWSFLGCTWLLQAIKLLLALAIVLDDDDGGPAPTTKAYLVGAAVLSSVNALPGTVWAHIFQGCALHVASWSDVLLVLDGISLILFYRFLRDEYYRNKELCLPEKFEQIRRNMNSHRRF